jgi:hypothetical protein
LQNPNQINGDNLQNLRLETSGAFMNKKSGYLKGKLMSLKLIIKTEILEFRTDA